MKLKRNLLLALPVLLLVLAVGCAQYKITHELETAIPSLNTCKIADMVDELPVDTKDENRPSYEDIQKLKVFLAEEFEKRDIMALYYTGPEVDYKVQGSILEFKKGSGFVRFITFGMAGSANLLVNLKLTRTEDDATVFGGNFHGFVTQWEVSGEEMFKQVARDFTKQLEKRLKKLRKEEEKG